MKFRVLSLLTLALLASTAQAVSFDCQKAKTFTEKAICQNPELSALDDELDAEYQAVKAKGGNNKALKKQQDKWLKERDACQTEGCVKKAYQKRIIDLTPNE
jgi:uncharacterized protein